MSYSLTLGYAGLVNILFGRAILGKIRLVWLWLCEVVHGCGYVLCMVVVM